MPDLESVKCAEIDFWGSRCDAPAAVLERYTLGSVIMIKTMCLDGHGLNFPDEERPAGLTLDQLLSPPPENL